ncbi:sulfite exporter TauE/SafE family protein [Nocardioides sp.]|uniref:sulfite exporter TauE/SafE family protein n=1 Tax=Nocardioides sp. TaxID=35761 RepID=UPI003514FBCD
MADPELVTLVLLALAALLAGFVDAVVGGGGLIQLPALVIAFPHATPLQLLATNKSAAVCGTSVAAVTYARRLRPPVGEVAPLVAAAFLGAAGGALVAALLPREVFEPIVLVLLLGVGTLVVRRPDLGHTAAPRFTGRRRAAAAAVVGAGIGCYDGALGPGTGTFLVIALVLWLGHDFLGASARARWANVATNLGALAVFVPQGVVVWEVGLTMGAAGLLGGWLGARTALERGAGFVRALFVVVVAGFVVRLGGAQIGWW